MKNRFIIAGYGGMGERHADRIRDCGYAEVTGIYDADPARRALARARGYAVCESPDALMALDADCALLATPNDTHAALVVALLESGRHVLVEKPAALNLRQMRAMYDAAERAGRLLSVGLNRRWDSDFLGIRQVLESGELGALLCLESRIHGSRGIPGGWRLRPEQGGGMLYDWGVHLIDQALTALHYARPEGVSCALSHALGYEVDDGFRLTLTFPGGARVYIEVGTCNFIAMPRFYVCARQGAAMIDDWRGPCRVTRCLSWDEAPGGTARLMSPRDGATTREARLALPPSRPDEVLRNFCAAARGEEALNVTRAQVELLTAVIDAAFASAASGAPASLTD